MSRSTLSIPTGHFHQRKIRQQNARRIWCIKYSKSICKFYSLTVFAECSYYNHWRLCFLPNAAGNNEIQQYGASCCPQNTLYNTGETHLLTMYVNLLWPIDTIWRQRSGSTLTRVMTCCLMIWHQAITWTNVDLSSAKSSEIHLVVVSRDILQPSITKISLKITKNLKF